MSFASRIECKWSGISRGVITALLLIALFPEIHIWQNISWNNTSVTSQELGGIYMSVFSSTETHVNPSAFCTRIHFQMNETGYWTVNQMVSNQSFRTETFKFHHYGCLFYLLAKDQKDMFDVKKWWLLGELCKFCIAKQIIPVQTHSVGQCCCITLHFSKIK